MDHPHNHTILVKSAMLRGTVVLDLGLCQKSEPRCSVDTRSWWQTEQPIKWPHFCHMGGAASPLTCLKGSGWKFGSTNFLFWRARLNSWWLICHRSKAHEYQKQDTSLSWRIHQFMQESLKIVNTWLTVEGQWRGGKAGFRRASSYKTIKIKITLVKK